MTSDIEDIISDLGGIKDCLYDFKEMKFEAKRIYDDIDKALDCIDSILNDLHELELI